jgi:hypothetical protein
MTTNKVYLAVGVEAARGTPESTTVGFIPIESPASPVMEYEDLRKTEYIGEESSLGNTGFRRMSEKWSYTLEMPVFTEAGTTSGIVGSIIKHFFGYAGSAQNATTGQYLHMMYPVADPETASAGYVQNDALTLNFNISEGNTVKNHAYFGGRVNSLTFTTEPGQHLMMSAAMTGQGKIASGTAIATPTFAAENLSLRYSDLTMYYGTITKTGTPPDYTDYTFGSATALKHDKTVLTLEKPNIDKLRNAGVIYPDKTNWGQIKSTLELAIDFDDPSTGFSAVDDRNAFLAAPSSTNFFLHWDTGTQAGTGDNHSLYIDLPIMQRKGGDPEFTKENNPEITLSYEGDYDSTSKYIAGLLIKNTSTAV